MRRVNRSSLGGKGEHGHSDKIQTGQSDYLPRKFNENDDFNENQIKHTKSFPTPRHTKKK